MRRFTIGAKPARNGRMEEISTPDRSMSQGTPRSFQINRLEVHGDLETREMVDQVPETVIMAVQGTLEIW